MSITLRDAQHLSWKTYKKFETVDKKITVIVGSSDALIKKTAEIAQKMKAAEAIEGTREKQETGRLLSELLFTAFVLAEQNGVELEDSFLQSVDEMILGFVT